MVTVSSAAFPDTDESPARGWILLPSVDAAYLCWAGLGPLLAVLAESSPLLVGGVAPQSVILLISISVAVAMLGPGSCSIDAALGRPHLDIIDQ